MKTTIALTAFAGLLSSASAQYFGLIAARSASPIHLQEITAAGESLWIGKQTAAFCPGVVKKQGGCPPGKNTNFGENAGSLYMGAEVPGGQNVYIDPSTGAVKYTIAHSGGEVEGAITNGWSLSQTDESYGVLSWRRGLLACSTQGDANKGPWQIFANIKARKFGAECLGFDALTGNNTKPDAWQYT